MITNGYVDDGEGQSFAECSGDVLGLLAIERKLMCFRKKGLLEVLIKSEF